MDYRTSPGPAPLLIVATTVTALDRATGEVLWQHTTLRGGCRKFTIHEQWVIAMDGEGDLHCLELASGRCVGVVKTGLFGASAFLFDGERFYVANDGRVAAFDWNGRELWKRAVRPNQEFGLGGLGVPGILLQPDYSRAT